MHEQEYHLYQGIETDDTTNQAHHCDQDTTWVVETHDHKLASFLQSIGATAKPCLHDGEIFVCDAKQLIAFIAESSGLAVELRHQKRRQYSAEQREAMRQRIAKARQKQAGLLVTTQHFGTQIGAIAGGADSLAVGGAL